MPIACGVDQAALMPGAGLLYQVDVQLLQLSARGVAEAGEILSRADDVREGKRGVALEAARQLLLQLVLQADYFRHAERAEILHCTATLPGLGGTDNPLYCAVQGAANIRG